MNVGHRTSRVGCWLSQHSSKTQSLFQGQICFRDADFPLFSGVFFRYFWPDPLSADPFPVLSIFSYFIFLFLNFLSLFVFIFCETARTRRFSVIFAKVQWHPCCLNSCSCCHTDTEVTDQARCTTRYTSSLYNYTDTEATIPCTEPVASATRLAEQPLKNQL